MAVVTYRGPRPELVPALPVPRSYVTEDLDVVGPLRRSKKPKLVSHEAPVLVRDVPTPCDPMLALGLAMIRRRPSPWFTVRFARGEYAEIAHRIAKLPTDHLDIEGGPDYGVGGPTKQSLVTWGTLRWSRQQINDVYAGEQKPLFINGELVWAPPGWRPATDGR